MSYHKSDISSTIIILKEKETRKVNRTRSNAFNQQIASLVEKINFLKATRSKPRSPPVQKENKNKIIQEEFLDTILVPTKTAPYGDLKHVKSLGSGTYGYVDEVEDENGNSYARKIVSVNDESNYATSMRELSAIATFQGHPSIVHTFDTFVDVQGTEYSIVMERMDGDLHQYWSSEKNPTIRMTHFKTMAQQILSGLDYLHSFGFVHRDIKSGNIFYGKVGGHVVAKVSLGFLLMFLFLTSFLSTVGRLWIHKATLWKKLYWRSHHRMLQTS
jgi:hypothetical protein